jgi:hypothetical protein
MKKLSLLSAIATLVLMGAPAAFADAKFKCRATDSKEECAFTVFDDKGAINFVIGAQQTYRLKDSTVGMKYCVAIGPEGTPKNDYPFCWDQGPPPPVGRKIVKANVINE